MLSTPATTKSGTTSASGASIATATAAVKSVSAIPMTAGAAGGCRAGRRSGPSRCARRRPARRSPPAPRPRPLCDTWRCSWRKRTTKLVIPICASEVEAGAGAEQPHERIAQRAARRPRARAPRPSGCGRRRPRRPPRSAQAPARKRKASARAARRGERGERGRRRARRRSGSPSAGSRARGRARTPGTRP